MCSTLWAFKLFTQQSRFKGDRPGPRGFSTTSQRGTAADNHPSLLRAYSSCTKHTKEQTMSHILDIQPHHPHYPPVPVPGPDSRPSPQCLKPARADRSCYATPPNWLAGWNCLVEEGMYGGEGRVWKRGGRDVFSSVS